MLIEEQNGNFAKPVLGAVPSVGETLSTGVLDGNDGLITEEGKHTHFDLFEFESCNLSNKFTPIEKLI